MDEELSYQRALHVDVLELLWGNILSIAHFEDVLNTVDDLNRTVRKDHADIASVEPAVFGESFLGFRRILEIT